MHQLNLTNGAAHVAIAYLQSLNTIEWVWPAGSLMPKLKSAKRPPVKNDGEKNEAYEARVTEWYVADFGEVELEEDQRDALKQAIKNASDNKSLIGGAFMDFTVELIGKLGLSKTS